MPSWLAIGNSNGPSNTIAGMPSKTLPRIMNATSDTAMNEFLPPGSEDIISASFVEKPDCVSAQAIDVATPIMINIAPDSAAVWTSIGFSRRHGNCR